MIQEVELLLELLLVRLAIELDLRVPYCDVIKIIIFFYFESFYVARKVLLLAYQLINEFQKDK